MKNTTTFARIIYTTFPSIVINHHIHILSVLLIILIEFTGSDSSSNDDEVSLDGWKLQYKNLKMFSTQSYYIYKLSVSSTQCIKILFLQFSDKKSESTSYLGITLSSDKYNNLLIN
jgi:hypothetical protein